MGCGGWRRDGGAQGEGRDTGEPVLAALNQIEGYWTALAAACRDFPVPERAALDPRGIESALSQAFIIEQIAPGLARLRLGGLELARLMGTEVRGMPLSALFLPAARPQLAEAVQAVLGGAPGYPRHGPGAPDGPGRPVPARVELQLRLDRGLIRAPLVGRMLLLPLRDAAGGITRALGGLQLDAPGELGRGPHRLAITGSRLRPLAMPAGWEPSPRPALPPAPAPWAMLPSAPSLAPNRSAAGAKPARAAVEALSKPLPPALLRALAEPPAPPFTAPLIGPLSGPRRTPALRVIRGGVD